MLDFSFNMKCEMSFMNDTWSIMDISTYLPRFWLLQLFLFLSPTLNRGPPPHWTLLSGHKDIIEYYFLIISLFLAFPPLLVCSCLLRDATIQILALTLLHRRGNTSESKNHLFDFSLSVLHTLKQE